MIDGVILNRRGARLTSGWLEEKKGRGTGKNTKEEAAAGQWSLRLAGWRTGKLGKKTMDERTWEKE